MGRKNAKNKAKRIFDFSVPCCQDCPLPHEANIHWHLAVGGLNGKWWRWHLENGAAPYSWFMLQLSPNPCPSHHARWKLDEKHWPSQSYCSDRFKSYISVSLHKAPENGHNLRGRTKWISMAYNLIQLYISTYSQLLLLTGQCEQ